MFQGRVVLNKIFIVLITFLVALNIYQFQIKQSGSPVLVNDSQLECLNNWRPPISTENVYGPEPFKGMKVAYLDTNNHPKEFEYEFSGCFYNSKIENIHVSELNIPLDLMLKTGAKDLYFYKSADSDIVTLYGSK
jgi:hypothetical protein